MNATLDEAATCTRCGMRNMNITGWWFYSATERFCPVCSLILRWEGIIDLSDAHVARVARHLFRAFDDVNIGREPLHDFDAVLSERGEHWYALAREAIRRGAVVAATEENHGESIG